MFSGCDFILWSDGCTSRNVSELSSLITQNGGRVRHRVLMVQPEEQTRQIVLFDSLRHLREQLVIVERTRTTLHMEYVLDSFVYDCVSKSHFQDTSMYTFEATISKSTKRFCLGDEVNPAIHYYVTRDIQSLLENIPIDCELPQSFRTLATCLFNQQRQAGLFLNLYNHSQAGKSTVLTALAKDGLSSHFNIVLCSLRGSNVLGSIFEAFSLLDRGYGQLGSYIKDPSKPKEIDSLGELFQSDEIAGNKKIILICDNLDTIKGAGDAKQFFEELKVIREKTEKYPFFSAFIGVGVYRSDMVPTLTESSFKFQPKEVIRFPTYFCVEEVERLNYELTAETGIHLSADIVQEIFDSSSGHPGFVSFYFSCIFDVVAQKRKQMDLATWRRISSGKYFADRLALCDLGKKIMSALDNPDYKEDFKRIVLSLLVNVEAGYSYNVDSTAETKVIGRLADFGIIRIDQENTVFFNCHTVWSQVMNKFCPKTTVVGPQFSASELESISLFDLLKSTLPFLSQLDVPLATKKHGNQRVPSEYAYQLELNKILSHAGSNIYRVFNEANHSLGSLRANLRLVNGDELAVLELMSHANDAEFLEHIRRTCDFYSVICPKHLAVVQFHTNQDYKVTSKVLEEIKLRQGGLDVFIVIHDAAFRQLKVQHVLHGDAEELNVQDIVSAMSAKRPLQEFHSQALKAPRAQSVFTNMEAFFEALKVQQNLEDEDVQEIRDTFANHRVRISALLRLEKQNLLDMGIKAVGLQMAILNTLR